MRTGLLLGEMAKNRFEPSQALACALKADEYDNVYDMDVNDEDVVRYLKCETVDAKTDVKDGWVLVTVDGFPLGWAKSKGNVLKNKYLPGWRMMT
jgi:NOL1/NOP2/fmu family ribosome biogenesis protein